MHLADALSKATYSAFRLYIYSQYVCSLGIKPTTFSAANTTLYHWATGTLKRRYTFLLVDYCHVLKAVWTLILTAPIHCRESTGDVYICNATFLQICSDLKKNNNNSKTFLTLHGQQLKCSQAQSHSKDIIKMTLFNHSSPANHPCVCFPLQVNKRQCIRDLLQQHHVHALHAENLCIISIMVDDVIFRRRIVE